MKPYWWRFGDKSERTLTILLFVGMFVLWNWNEWLTLVTYFHIYYESFTSSILGNFQAVPLMRDCLFDCQLFSYYGNFTSSILGNFQAVPLMRDIVYLTASYFLLWKFYLVTLGNFFQAAPLTRDCLILLPLVATLILSSIMGPFMFLFLGCHMPINFIIATTHFRTGTEREPPAARQW